LRCELMLSYGSGEVSVRSRAASGGARATAWRNLIVPNGLRYQDSHAVDTIESACSMLPGRIRQRQPCDDRNTKIPLRRSA
jgi:hypothetical protein